MRGPSCSRGGRAALCAILVIIGGCSCGSEPVETDAGADALGHDAPMLDVGADAFIPDAGPDTPTDAGSDAPAIDAGPLMAATFPQAIAGAMMANPDTYATIPVHVAVVGNADAVTVSIGGDDFDAAQVAPGDWVADVSLVGRPLLERLTLDAVARSGEIEASASAELLLTNTGVQKTDFGVHGAAHTPRLHRVDDRLFLVWGHGVESPRRVSLRELDGAGAFIGDEVILSRAEDDVVNAWSAQGAGMIVMLTQVPGTPYRTTLRAVEFDGTEKLASTDLLPAGREGGAQGSVAFDGTHFHFTWKVSRGGPGEPGEVRYATLDAETLELSDPVVAAAELDEDHQFDPFMFHTVAPLASGGALVAFVRDDYDDRLELSVPKFQVARIGATVEVTPVARELEFFWHQEGRVFPLGDGPLLGWVHTDLTDPDPNPMRVVRFVRADAEGALEPARGSGTRALTEVDDRGELAFVPAAGSGLGVVAWVDNRDRATDPSAGHLALYAADLGDDLVFAGEVRFEHARFIASTSELQGVPAGSNAMLVWKDERHGGSILDSRPEVWLETVWR